MARQRQHSGGRIAWIDPAVPNAGERCGWIGDGPRGGCDRRFCVIQDPAGAPVALIGP